MLPAVRLSRTTGGDLRAVVSVVPASGEGRWLVRVARGASLAALTGGAVYGPYAADEVHAAFDAAIASLRAEGFAELAYEDLIAQLSSKDRGARARAAQGLGWRRDRAAVPALLAAAEKAGSELPVIIDALGRIGDARAVPLARALATKKLLSRRRSGVEALRALGDLEGLATARNAAMGRLPSEIQTLLGTLDDGDRGNGAAISTLLDALALGPRAAAIDSLYEIGTPACVAAARHVLRSIEIGRPHVWRYAKSILKRTMLRDDARTFAILALRIERTARTSAGVVATVKSGLDGEQKKMRIFGKRTQRWAMRASYRHLRKLASWRKDRYAPHAAEVLALYGPEDRSQPRGLLGELAYAHLLHRILHGESDRHRVLSTSLRVAWRDAKSVLRAAAPREESFAALWDATPDAYLRPLARGRLDEVVDFALSGVMRHPGIEQRLGATDLASMAGAEHVGRAALAQVEIERRFDPRAPDLALLTALVDADRSEARTLGLTLAARAIETLVARPEALVAFIDRPRAEVRAALAGLFLGALATSTPEQRRALAALLVARARSNSDPDRALALARLCVAGLASEAAVLVREGELVAMLDVGSPAERLIAAAIVARREDALAFLGLPRLVSLASADLVHVRSLAHLVVRASGASLAADPSALFALADSVHDDTRALAIELLGRMDLGALGLDGVTALADATHADVRALAKEIAQRLFGDTPPEELLFRLSEHPRGDVRSWALALIETQLRPGLVPLLRIEGFVRATLLDARPDAKAKTRLYAFLEKRGLADEVQGRAIGALVSRVVRTRTVRDFERAIGLLAVLAARWPGLESDLRPVAVTEDGAC